MKLVDLLFFASSLSHNSNLEHLVSHLESSHGIEFRKQSLLLSVVGLMPK